MAKEERLSWRKLWLMVRVPFRGGRMLYVAIVLCIVVASAAQVAEPVMAGRIIDNLIAHSGDGLFYQVLPLVGLWALAYLVSISFSQVGTWLSWRAGHRVSNAFMSEALDRVLGWDPQRFVDTSPGVVAKQLDKAWDAGFNLFGRMLTDVGPIFLTSLAVFGTGLWLDWRMTLVSLVSVPFAVILTFLVYRRTNKQQDALSEAWEALSRRVTETIGSIVPIKAFAQEDVIGRKQHDAIKNVSTRQLRLNVAWAWLGFGNGAMRIVSRLAVLSAGAYFITQGTLSIGVLLTFISMLNYLLAPFDYTLADIMRRMSEIRSAFSRLAPGWFRQNQIVDVAHPVALKRVDGEITFDRVSFRYPAKGSDALKNLNFTVPAGSSLALVGPSGSGKSTLVRFINRFLDPTKGRVLLDGVDVRQLRLRDLRHHVGVVQQDTVLFNESVLENIRFAKPKAKKADVIVACKRAQAHEFIMALPKGYDTLVGERGVKLSGGERQRLALARVFLAEPPILILDESTSALDSETEHKLQIALADVMKGRTTIIIAHRLSTVYMANRILVLNNGKIVESGTHNQLRSAGGMYDRLWRLQSGGYLPNE